jgi:sigma-B regulation protein RsbU (phosphoserine phosphatase)
MLGIVIETPAKSTDQRYRDQLYALLQVTRAINNNTAAKELFSIYQYILESQLGFSKIAYCSFDEIWRWPICFNSEYDTSKLNPEVDLKGFHELTVVEEDESNPHLASFDVIIPVEHKGKALSYLLIGGLDRSSVREERKSDLEFVQTISNVIAVAIENKRLFKDNVQQEMYKRELEMAREVQSMFIPSSLPLDEHFDFAAFYRPIRQIGGDYYDFIRLNDEEVIFCMADVSGKGIAAALLMANFQAYLHARVSSTSDLRTIVTDLNDRVVQSAKGEKFVTFFIAKYNTSTRILSYINAGHNPPVLLSNGETSILNCGTTGLGMLEKLYRLDSGQLQIHPDAMLLCYTDGLVEQENEGGQDFGIEQLETLLKEHQNLSPSGFNEMLINLFTTYKGDQPYLDDIALLTCRFF